MLAATWNATLFDVLSNFLFLIAFIVPAIRNMWILDQFYDVERDRLNSHNFAKSVNKYMIPDIVAQLVTAAALLLCGQWLSFVCAVPLTAIHALQLLSQNRDYMFEPTLFRQKEYLKLKKRVVWVKLITCGVIALIFVLKFSIIFCNYVLGLAVYRFFGSTAGLVIPSI